MGKKPRFGSIIHAVPPFLGQFPGFCDRFQPIRQVTIIITSSLSFNFERPLVLHLLPTTKLSFDNTRVDFIIISPESPSTYRFSNTSIKMSKTFTKAEVANFKDEKTGMYIIIDDGVYDIACMFLLLLPFSFMASSLFD